mmetsp:Transcript_16426/g.26366  ORF Transcript_16426/g.26366 Transcript_16426/m.26366 type:complete len:211 (-) Transcript_16426:181-813(-)
MLRLARNRCGPLMSIHIFQSVRSIFSQFCPCRRSRVLCHPCSIPDARPCQNAQSMLNRTRPYLRPTFSAYYLHCPLRSWSRRCSIPNNKLYPCALSNTIPFQYVYSKFRLMKRCKSSCLGQLQQFALYIPTRLLMPCAPTLRRLRCQTPRLSAPPHHFSFLRLNHKSCLSKSPHFLPSCLGQLQQNHLPILLLLLLPFLLLLLLLLLTRL